MTAMTYRFREMANEKLDARREKLRSLPYDYANHLEHAPNAWVKNTKLLPDGKDEIVRGFLFCIANAETKIEISLLENALLTIPFYQDIGIRDTVSFPDPAEYDRTDKESVRLIAIKVQEFIQERNALEAKIHEDTKFIKAWIGRAKEANQRFWPFLKRWRYKRRYPYRTFPAECVDFPIGENDEL